MKKLALSICLVLLLSTGCLRTESIYSPNTGMSSGPILPLEDDRSVYALDTNGIRTLNVTVLPGGSNMGEVDADTDWSDDDKPTTLVNVSEPGYIFPNEATSSSGTLRIRGHTSRYADQKSYKITFDDPNGQWRNLLVLELNKHPYDLSRIRQKLSFNYFQNIPNMTGLRTQFIHMYIDEVDYGLFTLIERCDEEFLSAHGLDSIAHLYKAENFEFLRYPDNIMNTNDPDYSVDNFEEILEIRGKNDNHLKLILMLEDVNDEEMDIDTVMENHFQRDNYLTWFATNIVLKNDDTNSQNFFLYSPHTSNGWYFLPWDYDGAWDFYGQAQEAADGPRPRWTEGVSNWWNVVLHKKFLKNSTNLQDLIDKVEEVNQLFTAAQTTDYVDTYMQSVYDIITENPDLENLPTIVGSNDPAQKIVEFDTEIDRLPGIPEESYQLFIDTLGRPMPVWLSDPATSGNTTSFAWDESYDLQGDEITYDFQISTDPAFADANIVDESLGRTRNSIDVDGITAGTYYYRVIIRDDDDPDNNWQIAFDELTVGETEYYGIKQFIVQ